MWMPRMMAMDKRMMMLWRRGEEAPLLGPWRARLGAVPLLMVARCAVLAPPARGLLAGRASPPLVWWPLFGAAPRGCAVPRVAARSWRQARQHPRRRAPPPPPRALRARR